MRFLSCFLLISIFISPFSVAEEPFSFDVHTPCEAPYINACHALYELGSLQRFTMTRQDDVTTISPEGPDYTIDFLAFLALREKISGQLETQVFEIDVDMLPQFKQLIFAMMQLGIINSKSVSQIALHRENKALPQGKEALPKRMKLKILGNDYLLGVMALVVEQSRGFAKRTIKIRSHNLPVMLYELSGYTVDKLVSVEEFNKAQKPYSIVIRSNKMNYKALMKLAQNKNVVYETGQIQTRLANRLMVKAEVYRLKKAGKIKNLSISNDMPEVILLEAPEYIFAQLEFLASHGEAKKTVIKPFKGNFMAVAKELERLDKAGELVEYSLLSNQTTGYSVTCLRHDVIGWLAEVAVTGQCQVTETLHFKSSQYLEVAALVKAYVEDGSLNDKKSVFSKSCQVTLTGTRYAINRIKKALKS